MNNAASSKSRLHVDEMHNNVTKDYTKLVNMLYHTALLPDGCVPFEVGGKVANWNWGPVGHFTASDDVHVTCVRKLLDTNRWWTCAKLSGETGTASPTIHKTLIQNLKMQNIYASVWQMYTCDNIDNVRLHLGLITNMNVNHFFTRSWWWIRNGTVHMNLDWRDNQLVSPRLNMPTKMSTVKGVR